MKWSAKLGRFAGIDVYVHWSFLLLCGWIGYLGWQRTGTVAGVLNGMALIVLLFACVLLHEFGHALTARRFGIGTRHITLLPIGGVALLESIPENPRHEILIALAGPAVNLVIAAAVFALLALTGPGPDGVLRTLLTANLALAAFNLLPAFPMDGGRVLRAALALRLGRVRATRIAALIGRVLALGLGVLGLLGDPILLLIAAFVWVAAGAEARAVVAQANRAAAANPEARADA